MIVTLSNRRLVALIRQLENIEDNDSEILENAHRYGARLGTHLLEFGIQILSTGRDDGEVCDWYVQLISRNRENIIRGLQLLNPLNITVEYDDLPQLVLNAPMLACAKEAWGQIENHFARIQPGELLNLLESILGKVAFGSKSSDMRIETDLTFEAWWMANGLKVPGAAQNAYDRHREAEIAEEQKRNRERVDHWLNRDPWESY